MRSITLPILLAVSLATGSPVAAQNDFGDIISGVAQSMIGQQNDKNAYLKAQQLNTASGYRSYLSQFPQGTYRVEAERAAAKLGGSTNSNRPTRGEPGRTQQPQAGVGGASSATVEAGIGLSRSQRMQIQTQLTSLGYPTGVADGLWGSNTRSSIARWQTANKLSATGYVTARQVQLIGQQAGPRAGADTQASVGDDPVEERLLSLTSDERREIQRRLTTLGYSTGGVDGAFGANTRRALTSWQRDEGLRASGYLTADQLRELRRQTS